VLSKVIPNDNVGYHVQKNVHFWEDSQIAANAFVQKSQSRFFRPKKMFVSMSVTTAFFHVVLKVSGAIDKMDIYKMSVFLDKKRSPIGIK